MYTYRLFYILILNIACSNEGLLAQSVVPTTQQSTVPQANKNGTVIFYEPFNDNRRQWRQVPITDIGMGDQYEIREGVFAAKTTTDHGMVVLQPAAVHTGQAFSITLAAKVEQNLLGKPYGLVFGADVKNNMYLLMLNNEQGYALIKVQNGSTTYLIPWTKTDLLGDNASNVISVKSDKNTWSIYLNGQRGASVAAESFFDDGTGIFQSGFASIRYDDLLVKEWSDGQSFVVGPQEGRFLADIKNAAQASAAENKKASLLSKPFGTDNYPINWKNQEGIALVLKDIPNRFANISSSQKLDKQQGSTSVYTVGTPFVCFDMGAFESFETAKWQAGYLMANAATALGSNTVYSSNKSTVADEEEYWITEPGHPQAKCRACIKPTGKQGEYTVLFYVDKL